MSYNQIEEIIERDGHVLETTYGISMQPMLRQGENPIVISKITSPLKKRDVILFRCDSGKYLLHRIVKIKKNGFLTRGDNNTFYDGIIKEEQIKGILTGYYKGDKYIDCQKNFRYHIYSFFTPLLYFRKKASNKVRSFVPKFIKRFVKKIFNQIT